MGAALEWFDCGCPGRLRIAADEAGWEMGEDKVWRHPTNGEPPFHDDEAGKSPTSVAVRRPSILARAPIVIAKHLGRKFTGFMERMGLPHE